MKSMLYAVGLILLLVGFGCLGYVGFLHFQDRPPAPQSVAEAPPDPARPEREPEVADEEHEPSPSREEVFRKVDPEELARTVRVVARTETRERRQEEQLIVTGVLYLDHGRRIPNQIGRVGELPSRHFAQMRRVGQGTLILEGSSFLVHCGNASYSYSAGDLDQIVFQAGGVALVPVLPERPVPVFITGDMEQVKGYIKRHARIRSV